MSCLSDRSERPNVIFIYADDLGYGEIGANGQEKIMTPNLDMMAAEGINFTQHYTGAPVCAPARCMLMTGRHAGNSYIRGNVELGGMYFTDDKEKGQEPLPEDAYTLGHMFQQQGYVTGAIGKWGLGMTGNTGHPNKQGFDYFYGYLDQKQAHNYYPTHLWENESWDTLLNDFIFVHNLSAGDRPINQDAVKNFPKSHLRYGDDHFFEAYSGEEYAVDKMTEKALTFIHKYKDQPFFLYLPFTIPHVSLQVPDLALEPYLGKFDENPYLSERGYAPHKYPRAAYASMITYLDAQVGQVIKTLQTLGLDENTLVFFSSDNGPTFNGGVDAEYFNSTAGLRGLKMDLYEGGIRVPMLMRWPGKIAPGQVINHVSAQYDVMATLAELLGATLPVETDGISFLPTLLGKEEQQQKHPFLYFEYPEKGGQVAVRIGNWKGIKTGLIHHPDQVWELYNLEDDRAETTDLAAKHPEILEAMNQVVAAEHRPSHLDQWNFLTPLLK